MRLNNVDLNLLSTEDLKRLGLKYQIITQSEANSFDRDKILKEVRQFIIHKMQKYKSRPPFILSTKSNNPRNTRRFKNT